MLDLVKEKDSLPRLMQVSVERLSPVVMQLSVEVPATKVKDEVERAYANLAKKAHVKGFRPGKAPRGVLQNLYGSQIRRDVANELINRTLPQAIGGQNVQPISQPMVSAMGELDLASPFSYRAVFEIQPEIDEVKYEGFELRRPFSEVDSDAVDAEIESLRFRHAKLAIPELARPSKAGDVVTINFSMSIDGKEIADGGGKGVQLELGAGQLLPELDKAVTGIDVGSKVKAEATFSADHPRSDFGGKTAVFDVELVELKERVLAELDDEFAKDIGMFQTLVELRADVHTKLTKLEKERSEMALSEQIVEKLNECNSCDVPPSLVEAQRRMMEQEFMQQARKSGTRLNQDGLRQVQKVLHEDAVRKVRAGLVMAAIAKKNNFVISSEDVEMGMKELAQETGQPLAKIRAEYSEKQKRDMLVGMILEDKILTFIESKSTVVDLKKGEDWRLLPQSHVTEPQPTDQALAAENPPKNQEKKAKDPKSKRVEQTSDASRTEGLNAGEKSTEPGVGLEVEKGENVGKALKAEGGEKKEARRQGVTSKKLAGSKETSSSKREK